MPAGLDDPLTAAERKALPWAIARQPLWGIGGGSQCSMTRPPPTPRHLPAIRRALQLVADIGSCHAGLSLPRAERPDLHGLGSARP